MGKISNKLETNSYTIIIASIVPFLDMMLKRINYDFKQSIGNPLTKMIS